MEVDEVVEDVLDVVEDVEDVVDEDDDDDDDPKQITAWLAKTAATQRTIEIDFIVVSFLEDGEQTV